MYLYLALFWLGVGIVLQVFWERIATFAQIPVDRTSVGVFCFILMSYNFIRWRLTQRMVHRRQPKNERREPREYDPSLDFSQLDRDDPNKPNPAE